MKTNQTFSISRFMNVMKYDLGSNGKGYFYSFMTIIGIFLLCYILGFVFLGTEESDHAARDLQLFISSAISIVTPFFFYIGAGRILKVMRTKEGRESYLMLPATRLEKFVSRALISTLGVMLGVLLGIIVADLVRFFFHPIFHVPESMQQIMFPTFLSSHMYSLVSFLSVDSGSDHSSLLPSFGWFTVALSYWMHSFFILGGVLFCKHPVIKTFGCLFLMSLIFTNLVIGTNFFRITDLSLNEGVILSRILTMIFFVLGTADWWLSYHLFSRSQIIRKKLF